MKNNRYLFLISFWYIMSYCNFCFFLYNFFPISHKYNSDTLSPPTNVHNVRVNVEEVYKPEIDRLIIMVIDALRYDFVPQMPYTYSTINDEEACLVVAKADVPTVTMPRLKAMTTGSVPQFIDVVLNFDSKEIKHDSFLHRAKAKGLKMHFFGDDTWLKLYPDMFHRADGTTSFYVNDFTEVDDNVTRHLNRELKKKDWDILILHYLGLDHIGHVHGPKHPMISYKLQEMDDIVRKLHTSVLNENKKRTLILVCGDHGMKDIGGHGGSSNSEVTIPLIFLGLPCSKNPDPGIMIKQSDLAPTLSALMGLKIPADNIGTIITSVVTMPLKRRLYLLYYNALNILQNAPQYKSSFERIFQRHKSFLLQDVPQAHLIEEEYTTKLRTISEKLIQESTDQNVFLLCFSSVTAFALILSILFVQELKDHLQILAFSFVVAIIIICIPSMFFSLPFFIFYVYFIMFVFATKIIKMFSMIVRLISSPMLTFLFVGTLIRPLCVFSSTYIEEEYLILFYFWGTVTLIGALQELRTKKYINTLLWIALFAALRICRRLHRIGLFNRSTDFSDLLNEPENNIWLTIILILSMIAIAYCCRTVFSSKTVTFLSTVTTLSIYYYRYSLYYDKNTTFEAKIAEICIIATGIISYIIHKQIFKSLSIMWICWTALLMRPNNVVLIPVFFLMSQILFKLVSSKKKLLFLHYWLGYIFFNCQGIDNTLSSIDVSVGYVGLDNHSLFLNSFQIICHSYTFPILSNLLLFSKSTYEEQIKMLHTILLFRMYSIVFCCLSLLVHRQHLFIWSVFSPKLLIEGCHATMDFVFILCYLVCKCVNKK